MLMKRKDRWAFILCSINGTSCSYVFRDFYVFELLSGIMLGITTLIFYKIFANSITLIIDFGTKRAFTIEEVIGTSLLLAITVTAFDAIDIFGFSIKTYLVY